MTLNGAKRWHVKSILRSHNLIDLYADTPWEQEARRIDSKFESAVRTQDRGFLDELVPVEMLTHGASTAGLLAYRTRNGYLRSGEPGEPTSLASVLDAHGSEFVEDMLEFGSKLEPSPTSE